MPVQAPGDRQVAAMLRASTATVARDFLRRRLRSTAPDSPIGLKATDEQRLATHLLSSLVQVLEGTVATPRDHAADHHGARFAALGLSAADLIGWIRDLERTVTERVLSFADLELERLRRNVARISAWFDTLCTQQLDLYETTHDQLSGWYSRAGNDLMSYLVSGAPVDRSTINSQARALGVEPRRHFRAVAIRTDPGGPPARQRRVRHQLATFFGGFEPAQGTLVHRQGDLLLTLTVVEPDSDQPVEGLRALLERDEPRQTLHVAVGEPVDELAAAGRSCRQALSALEIAVHRDHRGRVTQCTEVILDVLLAHNPWVSERIVESRLSTIVDKPQLVETLRAYINCDMSLQRTAEELFVHPNTVAYRLRQIGSRTGRDMRRVVDLTELSVAMAALDVVHMKEARAARPDTRPELLNV